jgi:HlyD family secretion protein
MRTTQQLSLRLADAQIEAAQAELRRSRSAISPEMLRTQLEQAGERLKTTELRAPSDGTILHILAHEGELVGAQPILRMANTAKLIVLAEVYETDIARVKLGDEATMTSRIFSGDQALKGKVKWIGRTVGKSREVALDPRAIVDRRVVEVKIELPENKRAAELIGHQVHVTIGP